MLPLPRTPNWGRWGVRLLAVSAGTLLLVALWPASLLAAGPSVTVITTSGREFKAEIDPATSGQKLWLKTGRSGMFVFRPLEWSAVAEVRDGAKRYSGAEFRQAIEARRWPTTGDPFADPPGDRPRPPRRAPQPSAPSDIAALPEPEPAAYDAPYAYSSPYVAPAAPANLPVRSLRIEAYPTNWDADVEVDGLILHVFPLDEYGRLVPVQGVIDVDLIAQRRPLRTRDEPLPQIGRWSNLLTPEQFGPNGAVLQLPFQAIHPEYELDLWRLGLAHARLSVAGMGVFEASAGMVEIRPYSSIRDKATQLRGSRFFPQEATGQGVWNTRPTP